MSLCHFLLMFPSPHVPYRSTLAIPHPPPHPPPSRSVQNYGYYLRVEGGTGVNEKGEAYEIETLGFKDAGKIAYRNLSVYLTPSSNYAEARIYAIKSAADLFGQCSRQAIATTNAWFTVGVGDRYDSSKVSVGFFADTLVCRTGLGVNFSNQSTNFRECIWSFGDGDTSSAIDPVHLYSSYGAFDIKLKARSCFNNNWDSLTKTAYVRVDSNADICNTIFMPASGTDSLSFCEGYIYDEGGLEDYRQNKVTYLKVTSPGADSISITFRDLDYERNYDTLTLYRGEPIEANVIGKYFNSNLPNGGNPIVIPGQYISFRQWSDPFVVGRGFKLKFKAHKPPLKVVANPDTAICSGTSLQLLARGSGGHAGDYVYVWNEDTVASSYRVTPERDTSYTLRLFDLCTGEIAMDTVRVRVLAPLQLSLLQDTLVCIDNPVALNALATGGRTGTYAFIWSDGFTGASRTIRPTGDSSLSAYVTDYCSVQNDTVLVNLFVRPALTLSLNASDTVLCHQQSVKIRAVHGGGDTSARTLNWAATGGSADSITFIPGSSGWYRTDLSDNCSPEVRDSIYLRVLAPLGLSKSNDSTVCNGSNALLMVNASGGKPDQYVYNWSHGIPDTNRFELAVTRRRVYHITLHDGCSPPVSDSLTMDVHPDLSLSKPKDSTLCVGQSYFVSLTGSGGRGTKYSFNWYNGLGMGASKNLNPAVSTL